LAIGGRCVTTLEDSLARAERERAAAKARGDEGAVHLLDLAISDLLTQLEAARQGEQQHDVPYPR